MEELLGDSTVKGGEALLRVHCDALHKSYLSCREHCRPMYAACGWWYATADIQKMLVSQASTFSLSQSNSYSFEPT